MKVMKDKSPYYLSYLLRLWGDGKGADSIWRASLESPMTGERHGFASLKDLFAFLKAQADDQADPVPAGGDDVEPTGEE
jgi:hypothetical protein